MKCNLQKIKIKEIEYKILDGGFLRIINASKNKNDLSATSDFMFTSSSYTANEIIQNSKFR